MYRAARLTARSTAWALRTLRGGSAKLKDPEVIADETFMDIADILFPGTGFPEK